MKTPMKNTVCTVKLRKSEYKKDLWYLYIESFPVFTPGSKTPKRKHEYLNRFITTPIWDKTNTGRTSSDGTKHYRPKRNANGVILCKSPKDQEECIFADKVREKRQREYDNKVLYTEDEIKQATRNEKASQDFIKYFKELILKRYQNCSKSTIINWERELTLLKQFTKGKPLPFAEIDLNLLEEHKNFLINAPHGRNEKEKISRNTSSTYFSIFKAAIHQAFIDDYLTVDVAAKSKNITYQDKVRNYLTKEELALLAKTPCDSPILKRAALFSALTGMRHSDIQKLKWKEISKDGDYYKISFIQQKTKGIVNITISNQAYQLCGKPGDADRNVFEGLQAPSWINKPLKKWIKSSGITKDISFHCFRHTYATLQICGGTDIYTISQTLGHKKVTTTQIYAKIVDEKKKQAANAIVIDVPLDE